MVVAGCVIGWFLNYRCPFHEEGSILYFAYPFGLLIASLPIYGRKAIRPLLLLLAFALISVCIWFIHAYRCRTLTGRSDIILCGRMIQVDENSRKVVVDALEVYKGRMSTEGQQRILVDIVAHWYLADIMPPWPAFQTNKVAVFYLRKSFWSSSYEPIWISEKHSWQEALRQIHIPAIDLREANLADAIGQINRAVSEADPDGTVPAIGVDLTPPKVVVTNATGSPVFDPYVEQLTVRFKLRHAFPMRPEQRPITFMAHDIPVEKAIKIVTSYHGYASLQERSGKPVVGYRPDWLLECRTYPWMRDVQGSALSDAQSTAAGGWEPKPGIEGADDLEEYFTEGRRPLPYAMMLVPGTNMVMVLARAEWQERFGRIMKELSYEAPTNHVTNNDGITPGRSLPASLGAPTVGAMKK